VFANIAEIKTDNKIMKEICREN